ncbi:hypothetical protein PHO31112_02856 [Pandoraea horticolens]|uniref:Uncharacterized protein n=1 Tax=Pandoraea horticolens TaxID=2508298 RepID=A0A5E4VWF0_9BURK|nr:hypothetical protein PHO31112_02856 [Pandoraea horticolens]
MYPVSGSGATRSQLPATTSTSAQPTPLTSTTTQSSTLGTGVREARQADGWARTSSSLDQLLSPLRTTAGAAGHASQSTSKSTSTQATTVGNNVRLVRQAEQTGRRTEPPIHAAAVDALPNFIERPLSPGISEQLRRFEVIQERVVRGAYAKARLHRGGRYIWMPQRCRRSMPKRWTAYRRARFNSSTCPSIESRQCWSLSCYP